MAKNLRQVNKKETKKKKRESKMKLLRSSLLEETKNKLPSEPCQASPDEEVSTGNVIKSFFFQNPKNTAASRRWITRRNSNTIDPYQNEENIMNGSGNQSTEDSDKSNSKKSEIDDDVIDMETTEDDRSLAAKSSSESNENELEDSNPSESEDEELEDSGIENACEVSTLKPIDFKVISAKGPCDSIDVKVLADDNPIKGQAMLKSLSSLYGVNSTALDEIDRIGHGKMTEFQARALPALLQGRDLLATVSYKSGKTIGYLIPAIEILLKLHFTPAHGTGVIILLPTQELVHEYFSLVKAILDPHSFNCGCFAGINSKVIEEGKLTGGVNVVVATPGHLLQHVENFYAFKHKNLQYLVIDGADRMLDLGFEYEIKRLAKLLPKQRQTVMLSAVQTKQTENLAKFCLKKAPYFVDMKPVVATGVAVASLNVEYMVCPSEHRLIFLLNFLQANMGRRVVVLFASCLSTQFHYNLLNYKGIACTCIYGKKLNKRRLALSKFVDSQKTVLLCTNASAMEIDLPRVDWIVQYDPPDEPDLYLERRGRIVSEVSTTVQTLLVLRPEELGFVTYLHEAKVPTKQIPFPKIMNMQQEIQRLLKTMYFLHVSSRDGYMSFIKAYASHVLPSIFDVKKLDLVKVATSFGFAVPPYVGFDVHAKQLGKVIHKKNEKSTKVPVVFVTKDETKSKRKKLKLFVQDKC